MLWSPLPTTLFIIVFVSPTNCQNIIKTTTGDVRGIRLKALDREVDAYLGIPYAVPPLDKLRFRKPVPIQPWTKIYEANRKSPSCPQFVPELNVDWIPHDNIKEDCLYLNLWVPVNRNNRKATLVWIHGGAFLHGSSMLDLYDGQVLAAEGDIIVASMNYRIGIFGFLYSGTEDAPGNVGFHDQVLALRWIKANLASFGGEPSQITISGQSAGAISSAFHLISPLSQTLVKRAILQSGSAFHHLFALQPKISKLVTSIFSPRVGCYQSLRRPNDLLQCLRNVEAKKISAEEIKMVNQSVIAFFPRHDDDFLPAQPMRILEEGKFARADIMVGVTEDEGSLFLALRNWTLFYRDEFKLTKEKAKSYLMDLLRYHEGVPIEAIMAKYINHIPSEDYESILKATYDAVGDSVFVCPTVFTAEKYSEESSVYFYYYTHRSSQTKLPTWMGVNHMQEIPYVFGLPLLHEDKYEKEEVQFSRKIIRAWSSFVKSGKPEYSSLTQEWPKFSTRNEACVELNPRKVQVWSNPWKERCSLWR